MTSDELKRLETAWNGRESINEDEFFTEVLCHHSIPPFIRTLIYSKFCQGKSRISFQSFVIGIVILTKASTDIRLGMILK